MKTAVNNRICDAHLEAEELKSVIAPGFTINHNDTFLAPTFGLGGAGFSLQARLQSQTQERTSLEHPIPGHPLELA